jgi:hypothetical protein
MTFAQASQKRTGDYRRFAPFRTTDWRWKFALEHLRHKSHLRHWEDAAIKEAVRYLRECQRAQTARQLSNVKDRWPDLTQAHDIFVAGGALRDELEARLIAGETSEVIAAKSNTTAGVVAAFERYFFNVADARDAVDWMMDFAVGLYPGLNRMPTERECWCYMALAGGPWFVDILVDDHLGRPNPKFPNLHELAEKSRFLVRDFVTNWHSKKAGAATLRAGFKLLGPHYGVSDEKWTPMLRIMMKSIRMFYGLLPPRKGQRRTAEVEATFSNNHSGFSPSPIPSPQRQPAPIDPSPLATPKLPHRHSGSVANNTGFCTSVAAMQESMRQLLNAPARVHSSK